MLVLAQRRFGTTLEGSTTSQYVQQAEVVLAPTLFVLAQFARQGNKKLKVATVRAMPWAVRLSHRAVA